MAGRSDRMDGWMDGWVDGNAVGSRQDVSVMAVMHTLFLVVFTESRS